MKSCRERERWELFPSQWEAKGRTFLPGPGEKTQPGDEGMGESLSSRALEKKSSLPISGKGTS